MAHVITNCHLIGIGASMMEMSYPRFCLACTSDQVPLRRSNCVLGSTYTHNPSHKKQWHSELSCLSRTDVVWNFELNGGLLNLQRKASTYRGKRTCCSTFDNAYADTPDNAHLENEASTSYSSPAQAWELLRQDVLYLDWRARQDVWAIKTAHDKVVETLNPLAREHKSLETLRKELSNVQKELSKAHDQVHLSEARVAHTLRKMTEMEQLVNDGLLTEKSLEKEQLDSSYTKGGSSQRTPTNQARTLNVSGPTTSYSGSLKNFWYPIAFSADIQTESTLAIEMFEEKWVVFRGKDGRPGCLYDACAHRACPLSLGKVNDGCIQCPYHGWEYSTSGRCEKMPSTRHVHASVKSLPCIEHDGFIWIWPGSAVPTDNLPSLMPPEGFTMHAQITIELDVEHGLLMENLLDLAHAPFTHTSTFAKGWAVPNSVKFKTPAATLKGYWDPYPIDMEFKPPCMVLSTIGIVKPGVLKGNSVQECQRHLHQLHVCIPSSRGKTRLLYRMSLDFAHWLRHVPFIQSVWRHLANQVLAEDLRLVEGQQDRMQRGANIWNLPVAYDKLGVRYRKWRLDSEQGDKERSKSSSQH